MSSDSEKNSTIAGTFTRREILRYAGFTGLGLVAPSLLASDGSPDAGIGFRPSRYAATTRDARIAIAQAMAETQTPSISVALCSRVSASCRRMPSPRWDVTRAVP